MRSNRRGTSQETMKNAEGAGYSQDEDEENDFKIFFLSSVQCEQLALPRDFLPFENPGASRLVSRKPCVGGAAWNPCRPSPARTRKGQSRGTMDGRATPSRRRTHRMGRSMVRRQLFLSCPFVCFVDPNRRILAEMSGGLSSIRQSRINHPQ